MTCPGCGNVWAGTLPVEVCPSCWKCFGVLESEPAAAHTLEPLWKQRILYAAKRWGDLPVKPAVLTDKAGERYFGLTWSKTL